MPDEAVGGHGAFGKTVTSLMSGWLFTEANT
jgi:hypothetical protein